MMNLAAILIVGISVSRLTEGSFSSVEKVAATLVQEKYVVNAMEALITMMEKHIEVIQKYAEKHGSIHETGLSSISLFSHPVNGFVILKRLVKGWKEIEDTKTKMQTLMTDAFIDLNGFRKDVGFPDEKDFNVTTESIIILENTYHMNVKDLSEGVVRDTKDNAKVFEASWRLSAWDCLHFGKTATSMKRYGSAVSWYQEALRKRDGPKNEEEVKALLKDAIKTHDMVLVSDGLRGDDFSTYSKPFDSYLAQREVYTKNLHNKWYPTLYRQMPEGEEEIHWEKLCRGEDLQPSILRDRLLCHHIHDSHSYFLLRPLKVEERSLDPYIVVIHEFMSDNETEQVIETGSNKLGPSLFFNEEGEKVTGVFRTSLNAWLYQTNITEKLSRRIELALALDVTQWLSAEPYQVANYGVGGRYGAHVDFISRNLQSNDKWGDRLVTFMAYLSDVDAGGATVFPRAGASVWPKKGSAVVWFNLFKNGEGDEDTRHGGCPVIHGTKWIANKWIRSKNQMNKARCSTEYYEKFDANFWNSKLRN